MVGLDAGQRPRDSISSDASHSCAVRPQERRARLDRGGLAKINAIQPRQQIDHLAEDAAGLDADAGVVAVNGRRVGQVFASPRAPCGRCRRRTFR